MREVPGFRGSRSCRFHFIFVAVCSLTLLYSSSASAQSGSGSDQPQVQAPEKPFDPSKTEPTSLHTTAKDDVRRDTPELKIRPGKMLHTDVDVALVNVAFTARGRATVVEEPMTVDPEYASVSIAVDHVDDHRQPAFRVTAGVDREWVDQAARAAAAARVHALSNASVPHPETPTRSAP